MSSFLTLETRALWLPRIVAVGKYAISGGCAAVANIGTLYVLTEYVHVYYIVSAVIAFVVAFFVSFPLQKFWTFRNRETAGMHTQMGVYLLVSVCNMICNAGLLFLLVEQFHVWYIGAEITVALLLAVVTFFVYRVIFRTTSA